MLPDIVHRQHVRVIESACGLRFVAEAPKAIGVRREGCRQDLDGDAPTEPRIPRAVHFTHSACGQEVENLVRPEPRARLQGHKARLYRRAVVTAKPCVPLTVARRNQGRRRRAGAVAAVAGLRRRFPSGESRD